GARTRAVQPRGSSGGLELARVSCLLARKARPRSGRWSPGPQHDQSADHEHESAEPNPPHEWIDREAENGLLRAIHEPSEHHVEIDAQTAHDPHFGGRLECLVAEGVDVLPFLRAQPPNFLAVALYIEQRRSHVAIECV